MEKEERGNPGFYYTCEGKREFTEYNKNIIICDINVHGHYYATVYVPYDTPHDEVEGAALKRANQIYPAFKKIKADYITIIQAGCLKPETREPKKIYRQRIKVSAEGSTPSQKIEPESEKVSAKAIIALNTLTGSVDYFGCQAALRTKHGVTFAAIDELLAHNEAALKQNLGNLQKYRKTRGLYLFFATDARKIQVLGLVKSVQESIRRRELKEAAKTKVVRTV